MEKVIQNKSSGLQITISEIRISGISNQKFNETGIRQFRIRPGIKDPDRGGVYSTATATTARTATLACGSSIAAVSGKRKGSGVVVW